MKKIEILKAIGLFLSILLVIILMIRWEEDPMGPDPIDPPIVTVKYTITASVIGEGGSINPEEVTVNKGSDVFFNLYPDPGYNVDTLLVEGFYVFVSTTANTFNLKDVTSNCNVEVKFKKMPVWYLIQNLIREPWTSVRRTATGNRLLLGS